MIIKVFKVKNLEIRILIVLFLLFQNIYSQKIKEFSSQPDVFIEELESFMSKNISKDDKAFLTHFIEEWKTDSLFFSEKKENIINISNLLLNRKCRPFPDFKNYFNVIETFRKNPDKQNKYQQLENSLFYLLENRKISNTKIRQFLNGIPKLIEQNIIFSSSYVEWKSSSEQFVFIIEEDKLKIKFKKTTLTCYANKDSLCIFETKGWVDPIENKWYGEEGLVTWERAGYNPDDVNARLMTYEIELKKTEYFADNVQFTDVFYFDHPLIGVLNDKVKLIKEPSDASYPKFDSYTKLFKIEDFYENIDYVGGLSMRGAKLIGTGSAVQKANLFLYNNDTLFMKASSVYFAFTKEKVIGRNTAITLYLKQDSIFHPDLLLTYLINKKELSLLRTDDYTSQSPYFNSYHMVDMNFEQLVWRFGEPYLLFTMARGSTVGNASFESANFFNMNRFNQIQLVDPVHPLIHISRFTKIKKTNDFYGEDFADYLKLPLHEVKRLLMRLSFLGFIFYNFETDEVSVKEKLRIYLESSAGKRDYDVLYFESVTSAPQENAILDLKNFDLTINGMPRVFISDSQNVYIYPEGSKIIMKRNRSFQFNGRVDAGLFTLWGNNFFFNYDSFAINLQNIDSIQIRYITDKKDNFGFSIIGRVESMIQHVTGDILVDDPNNKSGLKNYPQYPIFRSREKSYVYYNDKKIQNGVYRPEDFYFHLEPFEIDSLDNFSAAGLHYDGTFYSADIFPVFDETLRLQSDYSLGFKSYTDDAGIDIYKGKGKYYNLIHLSNKGLRGNGTLEYLTSMTKSDDFIFLPDSMNTHAQEFMIAKQTTGTQYPMVKSNDNYIHWEPYNDSWMTYQDKGPFTIYNDTTHLSGSIHLQPSGLTGQGNLDMKRAVMNSKNYDFQANTFNAKNADFELRSTLEGTSVKTDSVDIFIDYISKKGDFKSINDFTQINFPENRYITHADVFSWIMYKKEMEFKKEKSIPAYKGEQQELKGATYLSLDSNQDSLQFVSPLAIYDYSKNLIKAEEVEYFNVADAIIYPDKGNVTIEPKGAMRPLINANILTNTTTNYHKLHNANITVTSSKNYFGSGIYDYIDENKTIQEIYFSKIAVDDSLYTYANGNITENKMFKLSPYYDFQGKVSLHSTEKYLTFDGATRVVHNCEVIPPRWLIFKTMINPDSIYIPVSSTMKDINGRYIFAGSMIRYDSIHVYPSFFNVWQNYSDKPIISANGYLHYDKGGNRFKIASVEKINDFTTPGNYLSLNRDECELYGEGKIDLNIDLGQVKLESVGNTRHNVTENELKMDIMLAVDFHIPDNIIELTARDIDSVVTSAVEITDYRIKKGYNELLGKEKTDKYYEELSLYGIIDQLPEELKHTIFFNELKLVWNRDSRSYQSVGKIGISNILDKQINKYVDGFIEIVRKRSGDKMDIFLLLDDNNWYYFGYTRGVMQVISSNKIFINLIRNLKNRERRAKVKGIKTPYNIIVSTDRKYLMFVQRWQDIKEEREKSSLNE